MRAYVGVFWWERVCHGIGGAFWAWRLSVKAGLMSSTWWKHGERQTHGAWLVSEVDVMFIIWRHLPSSSSSAMRLLLLLPRP